MSLNQLSWLFFVNRRLVTGGVQKIFNFAFIVGFDFEHPAITVRV
jgi:hypothetical protein